MQSPPRTRSRAGWTRCVHVQGGHDEVAAPRGRNSAIAAAVLRPRVRVGLEAGIDGQVAGIEQVGGPESGPSPQRRDQPGRPQPARRQLHAGEVAAERGRDADDRDDGSCMPGIVPHH